MFFGTSAITSAMIIRKGGTAKLSVAQIAMLILDMAFAKKNVSKEEYKELKKIYAQCQKENKAEPMDMERFLDVSVEVAKRFETVTPFYNICDREAAELRPILERLGE